MTPLPLGPPDRETLAAMPDLFWLLTHDRPFPWRLEAFRKWLRDANPDVVRDGLMWIALIVIELLATGPTAYDPDSTLAAGEDATDLITGEQLIAHLLVDQYRIDPLQPLDYVDRLTVTDLFRLNTCLLQVSVSWDPRTLAPIAQTCQSSVLGQDAP